MITGAGLGFRRNLAEAILDGSELQPRFVEFAPENWIGLGGKWGKVVNAIVERFPILCHGLSLSIGSPEPLDWDFLREIKAFLASTGVVLYSEHLSYSKCDNAHLYDLLPIPFREDAVHHAAARIRQVQDYLDRRIAIENVSYYTPVTPEMDEATFIRAIIEEADCDLLLDINNVYVNAFNHGYNAKEYISQLPLERVSYIHMAGHEQTSETLIIDTHGQSIVDPVFDLFDWTLSKIHPVPVLLERDFNFPEVGELAFELGRLQEIIDRNWTNEANPSKEGLLAYAS